MGTAFFLSSRVLDRFNWNSVQDRENGRGYEVWGSFDVLIENPIHSDEGGMKHAGLGSE